MWEKISKWFFLVTTAIGAIVIFYFFRKSDSLEEEIMELRKEKIKEKIYDAQTKLDTADANYETKRKAYADIRAKHSADLVKLSTDK